MENMAMDMGQQMPQAAPEEAGRGTDTVMAHLSLGEVVIPRAFLDDPQVMQALQMIFQDGGADMAQYTVGDPANSINPETGYPEFFFKSLRKFVPILNVGKGWNDFRDSVQTNAVLAGNYLLPGSSLLTSQLASKGAQDTLNSGIGRLAQAGTGAAGAGVGSNLTGIPAASSVGAGWGNLGDALGLGTAAGTPVAGGVGPTQGSGIVGGISRAANSVGDSLGALTGSTGGGSTLSGVNTLASAFGGLQTDASLKKQKEQLLAAQNQQLGNLQNLNPVNVQNDPGYQFNLQQGQQGLDRKAAASGGLFSGAALQDASRFNQDFANNYYQQAFGRQAGIVDAQNNIYGNTGNINANATLGRSNNLNQTLANAFGANVGNSMGANNISNADLMALLKQRGLA